MSLYLPVTTKGSSAIAVCDRCKMKVPYGDLRPDGNTPGLMVCQKHGCWDVRDPYRLPPRQPESFDLRNPRPEEPLE